MQGERCEESTALWGGVSMTKLKGSLYCSKQSVPFWTSSSSLALDASAELAGMEATQRAPPGSNRRLGAMLWGADGGGADVSRADVSGADVSGADVSGSGGHADSGGGAERGGLEEIEGQIAKIRAALTEFLEELGLKQGCDERKCEIRSQHEGTGEGLSRGAALVSELVSCVEEQGKLRVKLRQVCSGGGVKLEERAGSTLSFSTLVSGAEKENRAGLDANPGSVDRSLSEDTDAVVMSDSEEGGPSDGEVGEGVRSQCSEAKRRVAESSNRRASQRLALIGSQQVLGTVTEGDAFARSEQGAESRRVVGEESGSAAARGPGGKPFADSHAVIQEQLEQCEMRLQELQSQALADVAAAYRAVKPTAVPPAFDEKAGEEADVAEGDWPEETRAAAT